MRLEKFYRTDNVGAVFYVAGGETSVTVIGGEISSNRTKLNSSVLRIDSGTMTVKDGCVITSNVTVGSRGDTFYVNGGTLVLDGVEVSGNGRASGTSSQGAEDRRQHGKGQCQLRECGRRIRECKLCRHDHPWRHE